MLEVIGAGFGRTGTHSLAAVLETLGFGPCYHMLELSRKPEHASIWEDALSGKKDNWQAIIKRYRSTVEWPAVSFLHQILDEYPEAKVVLTDRPAEEWYESARATIFEGLEMSRHNPDPARQAVGKLARRLILEGEFGGRYRDKGYAIEVYQRHVERVSAMVPAERLLRYQITEGWGTLCRFLGVEQPKEGFPRKNERSEFLAGEPEWAKEVKKRHAPGGESTKRRINDRRTIHNELYHEHI